MKILNGLFLCCYEQMKKNLEGFLEVIGAQIPKENKAEFRSCHSGKESLFCALMYEDTCQKKKGKQISLRRKVHFRPTMRKSNEETNPKPS